MGLLTLFGNKALSSFKDFSNEVNKAINDFEFEDIDKAFDNMQKHFDDTFKKVQEKIGKRVKDTEDKLEINIPYDRSADNTLTTSIENNQFKAVVKSEDGTEIHSTNIYIGDDVDVDSVVRRYDNENHLMYFTFDKLHD